ncbi:hypothetical protein IQ254_13240 [Nodosilinea sp. LEGE 07088]|uniref:hypothetical protein n=1 Tax=Nodosilinea sp. LEGE 07088 TaxID=2777968 RepID=UPI001882C369|nr:hypothetical protein [Nodosilinea sp. LEGE 07088]MBE9138137.1 hypothetical protein [Nodosilinea sp. LEGE 07088]
MVKGRQQRRGAMAAIAVATSLIGLVAAGYSQQSGDIAQATHDQPLTVTASQGSAYYKAKADTLLAGVLVPLRSLPVMQRAIILTAGVDIDAVPTLALLAAPLKTTGLGPIRIGMDLDDLRAAGLAPVVIDEASQGECQYYRIQDQSEPIGILVINDQVLRVDVWPGSLTMTQSGIKIGSTERDLVQAYGEQLEATANPITLGKTVVFTPQDPGEDVFRLVFETDDQGQVTQFRGGQFPAVTWSEGCL